MTETVTIPREQFESMVQRLDDLETRVKELEEDDDDDDDDELFDKIYNQLREELLDDLLTKLWTEQQQRQQLEQRVDELEDQARVEWDGPNPAEITIHASETEHSVKPYKAIIDRPDSDEFDALEQRIAQIERGEVEPGELVAESGGLDVEDLLPLHQKYNLATHLEPELHDLTANQEIAARVFPYLAERAYSDGHGSLVLTSTKIRDIIENEVYTPELEKRLDVKSPNPNTVGRVIDFIDRFTPDWWDLDEDAKPKRFKINRQRWIDYTKDVADASIQIDLDDNRDYTVVSGGEA